MPAFSRKAYWSRSAYRTRRLPTFITFLVKAYKPFPLLTSNNLYHRFRYLHHIGYLATYPVMVTRREVLSRFSPYVVSILSHCRDSSLFISLGSSSDMDGFLQTCGNNSLIRPRVALLYQALK